MAEKEHNANHESDFEIPIGRGGVWRPRMSGFAGGAFSSAILFLTVITPLYERYLEYSERVQISTDATLKKKLEEVTDKMVESKGRGLFLIQQNDELKRQIDLINRAIETLNKKQAEYLAALKDCQERLAKCGVKK